MKTVTRQLFPFYSGKLYKAFQTELCETCTQNTRLVAVIVTLGPVLFWGLFFFPEEKGAKSLGDTVTKSAEIKTQGVISGSSSAWSSMQNSIAVVV